MPTLAFSNLQHIVQTNSPTLTSASFTPQTGDIIVVKVVSADAATQTIGTPSGGGWTYTSRVSDTTASHVGAKLFTAPVTTGGTAQTVATAITGSGATASMVVEVWRSAQLAASPATVDARGTGAPSATITTAAASSYVTWLNGDWAAVSSSGHTYNTTSATPTEDGLDDQSGLGQYVAYYAYQAAAAAGSQTLGLTAPTGQTWTLLGIEIQDAGGAAPPPGGGGALPGRTWLRRFHHPQQLPSPFTAAVAAPAPGTVPPLIAVYRRSRALFRALTGNSGQPGDGITAPFPPPSGAQPGGVTRRRAPARAVTAHAAGKAFPNGTAQPLPARTWGSVFTRRPARAVFAGLAVAPVLAHPANGALVAQRAVVQHSRAVTAHAYGAPAPPVSGPSGSPPGGVVLRRRPARAVTGHAYGRAVTAGPAGNPPGGLVVRRVPSGAIAGGFASSAVPAAPPPAGKLPPRPLVAHRAPARAYWSGTVTRTVNAAPGGPPRGNPPGGLVVRRVPTGAVAGGLVLPRSAGPAPAGSSPGGTVARRRPARGAWLGKPGTPPAQFPLALVRPQVTSRRPVTALWGGPPTVAVNAHGPAGRTQPQATVPVPRRYPARAGTWRTIQGQPPPSFFVARSASAVTDPRDGSATVTAVATSASAVTDPRDGTAVVT